jgi:radical SAM protein (TIGR01212 family)
MNMTDFTYFKPYHTLNDFYQEKFQSKVFKVALNGDFSCPNRDGALSDLGCIFCSEKGSGDFAGERSDSLENQFQMIKDMMQKKWPDGKMIAFFQANTNTYGPIEKLKLLFEKAIQLDPKIVGLSIATRPDCLSNATVEYLADLSQRTFLTVELGLQTIHESTAIWMNRGYKLDVFEDAISRLSRHNIRIVVHIINGLKNETKAMMLKTIHYLNHLPIYGIKIHMLNILKNTPLEREYISNPFSLMSLEEYVDTVASQIAEMNPTFILERLTGDAPKNLLIEPKWTLKKFVVTNEIDKLLRNNHWHQGIHYHDQKKQED